MGDREVPRPLLAARYGLIEAPSVLGLRPTGVELLSSTLIDLGLMARLDPISRARVDPPPYSDERDPDTRMLNPRAIREYSVKLADAVGNLLDGGHFPVVLGGDCSILLGNLLALSRRGRYGLLFIDGHADFYQPEANVNGEAASSELAFATGRGPDMLTTFEGRRPLVRDQDVVALAHRDESETREYGSQPLPAELLSLDLPTVRRIGIAAAMRQALERLESETLAGFWIHLDADALDDAIMPAVDYRMPGGLSWEELELAVGEAACSRGAIGLDVSIYNPRLDPDRRIGRRLVDAIAGALRPGSKPRAEG